MPVDLCYNDTNYIRNGFFQPEAEDAFKMQRLLKIHVNVGQGQVSPSPPGPLVLWLGIKKAHKGEWALSPAQPAASVPGAGQIIRTTMQCIALHCIAILQ